ncbi:MAG: cation:proton antiporter, partial [Bacillus sp. (in: firmicutes)]
MEFILELAIILFASKIAGNISVKLGQPSVLGKLLIGVILGPAVLGIVSDSKTLAELSQIGVILLMFIAGMETDLNEFKRTWKASTFVGISGIIVPLFAGYLAGILMNMTTIESLFLGL